MTRTKRLDIGHHFAAVQDPRDPRFLTHRLADLLTIDDCIEAVENAFGLLGRGEVPRPAIAGMRAGSGGFHIKAGLLELGRTYFAAKTNANFPQNMQRFGLPLIQGIIVLCDGEVVLKVFVT